MIFRQVHEAGRLGLSDFTALGDLGITVAGVALDHRLYHFRLACSAATHKPALRGSCSHGATEQLARGLRSRTLDALVVEVRSLKHLHVS